ncbi:MAG TPA: hypothetical protein VFW50_30190 [Streptosporangiaceae bacterium]|nr:hypothetical protein [Streptosporangiaceae bacterium]
MSYDPSHRTPPRQERWPQATPAEGWPPYRGEGEGEQAGRHGARAQQPVGSHRRQAGPRSAVATAAFPVAGDTYGTADAHDTGGYDAGAYDTGAYDTGAYDTGGFRVGDYTAGSRGRESYGYPGTGDGYSDATDGFDGAPGSFGRRADSFNGTAGGFGGYTTDPYTEAQSSYAEPWDSRAVTETSHGRAETRYSQADGGYGRAANGYAGTVDGYAGAANGTASAPDGYPGGAAYLGPGSYTETAYSGTACAEPGYSGTGRSSSEYLAPGQADAGYAGAGYAGTGYSETDFSGRGYSAAGYSDPGYFESGYSDPELAAPDAGVDPYSWQADQAFRRAARHRGLMVSAATEFLAIAVVIGVSTLAAGLLKSTVSPAGALGTVFVDRMPAMLRGSVMHHFGTHGRTVLLLGMYAVIAVIAIAIGAAARRGAALGVAGVAAFALVVAFVTVTRPGGRVSDVMPAVIGGLAGVAALLWLVRASAPIQEVTPLRPARGGTRRRTR